MNPKWGRTLAGPAAVGVPTGTGAFGGEDELGAETGSWGIRVPRARYTALEGRRGGGSEASFPSSRIRFVVLSPQIDKRRWGRGWRQQRGAGLRRTSVSSNRISPSDSFVLQEDYRTRGERALAPAVPSRLQRHTQVAGQPTGIIPSEDTRRRCLRHRRAIAGARTRRRMAECGVGCCGGWACHAVLDGFVFAIYG